MEGKNSNNMARQLPVHLSHKSALALLPPSSITDPIEAVRRVRDKQFSRWPPHINLLYPFLTSPSNREEGKEPQLKQNIQARVQAAVRNIEPFYVHLDAAKPGIFSHGRISKTVSLSPSTQGIQQLQAALQAEFAECDDSRRRFVPHLSIGQAQSKDNVDLISQEIKESVTSFLSGSKGSAPTSVHWKIDRVFVIEREGFEGRFKIVGTIELETQKNKQAVSLTTEETPQSHV